MNTFAEEDRKQLLKVCCDFDVTKVEVMRKTNFSEQVALAKRTLAYRLHVKLNRSLTHIMYFFDYSSEVPVKKLLKAYYAETVSDPILPLPQQEITHQ